ncbi:hypothetical protein V2I01_21160 [Micromonospora sp. BRA006-A]|nr:hypothetical protein [Micromonospora sp. BRA006-A]
MVPSLRGRPPVYRPVLAARRGELEALTRLDDASAALLAPILDVPADAPSIVDALNRLPDGLLPAVDVSALPDSADHDPARWGVPLVPVIGLADSDRRLARTARRPGPGRTTRWSGCGSARTGPDRTPRRLRRNGCGG